MRYLLFILFVALLAGCINDDVNDSNLRLRDGYYDGTFHYDTLKLWESFGIKTDSFVEYASGGVMYQKYPKYCLTKGIYKIISDSIHFNNIKIAQPPNYDIINCDKEYLLMGNYFIAECTDSIIYFWRIAKNGKQEYNLKLYYSGK